MRTLLRVALAIGSVTVISAQSNRQWQDGTWTDTDRISILAGSVSNATGTATTTGSTTHATANGSTVAVHRVSQVFVIETADRWYVASQRLRWRWSKPVPMTVNTPVKFAVEKDKLYVVGEDQKEYELTIEKKGLKAASTSPEQAPSPTLLSVAVSCAASLIVGRTTTCTATAHFSDWSAVVETAGVVWRSSSSAIAAVDAARGVLVGFAPGTVTISATFLGLSGTASVSIDPEPHARQ
jgi:hypothetical protein